MTHEDKHQYALRPLKNISKVQKKTANSFRYNKNGRKFRNLKSVTNLEPYSTSVSLGKVKIAKRRKITQECSNQEPSCNEMDVSNLIDEADLLCLADIEYDALQLSKYLESDGSIDQISESPKNDNTNLTTSNTVDPPKQSASIHELCIKGTQIATCEFSVAPINRIRTNTTPNVVVDKSNGNNDHADTKNCFLRNMFPSPEEQSMFGVSAESIIAPIRMAKPIHNDANLTPPPKISELIAKDVLPQMTYITLTKNVALKRQMMHLFNRSCYKYLNGRCGNKMCKWNHNLPDAREISRKLMCMSDETIAYMYSNFVSKSNMAFVTYFPTMCELFGKRNMDSILLNAIRDCERRERIPFLKFIFNGLVLAGSSKRGALTMIINHCSKNKSCFDVLLEIIIETDALYFVDLLKKYYQYGTINMQLICILLQQVTDAPGTALLPVFIDILDKYSMYSAFDMEFKYVLSRVKNLVEGNLILSQQLVQIGQRIQ